MALALAFGLSIAISGPVLAQGEDIPGKLTALNMYRNAVQAFQVGDFNTCVAVLKQAARLDNKNKNIYHLLALAQSSQGENDQSLNSFRQALSLDYNFVEARNNYGIQFKKMGRLDEAKHQFEECIRINRNYPKGYYNLGTVQQEQGDLDLAIESFRTATRLDPAYFDAQRDLGLAIFQKFERGDGGEISESLEKLQTACKLVPSNALVHYHMANLLCCNGSLDDGEAELRIALKNDPKLAAGHYELARLRYLRGDPNRALFEVKEAQKISPTYTEGKKYPALDRIKVKQLQAKCEELTERFGESIDSWKDVAALTANNKDTNRHIAELARLAHSGRRSSKEMVDPQEIADLISQGIRLTEGGDLLAAEAAFDKATQLDPKSWLAFQHLGEVLDAEGKLQEAAAKYQVALDLKPKYDGLYYNMAYLLERLNMTADAGAWYKRFHELAGKYPYDPKHIVALQQEEAREKARSQRNY